jgi:hypothetical protein
MKRERDRLRQERGTTVATAAKTLRRLLLAATIAAIALVATTLAPASAGTAATSSTSCPSVVEHPFLRWADPAAYTLAPGGDFEGKGTRWQLSRGVKLTSGNEPYKVHRSTDSASLFIPAGGSVVSPSFCVGLGEPTLRFFAVGGSALSPLKVEVLYRTALGHATQTVALVPAMKAWGPSLQTPIVANLAGLSSLDGLTSTVQLRFSVNGTVGWTIDDVYVDPWKVT